MKALDNFPVSDKLILQDTTPVIPEVYHLHAGDMVCTTPESDERESEESAQFDMAVRNVVLLLRHLSVACGTERGDNG